MNKENSILFLLIVECVRAFFLLIIILRSNFGEVHLENIDQFKCCANHSQSANNPYSISSSDSLGPISRIFFGVCVLFFIFSRLSIFANAFICLHFNFCFSFAIYTRKTFGKVCVRVCVINRPLCVRASICILNLKGFSFITFGVDQAYCLCGLCVLWLMI